MGCPATCYLGDSLVFSIATHDPDTGIVTDADAVPPYRVYEGLGTGKLLNGTMTLMVDDDAAGNTTGFYLATIACTTANGFEHAKNYTVYIEATVGGDKGAIAYTFKAIDKDYALKRDMSDTETEGAAASARSPLNAFRFLRNKWSISGTTLSVKKENDDDEAWNATVAGDSNANPVVSVDPAGP